MQKNLKKLLDLFLTSADTLPIHMKNEMLETFTILYFGLMAVCAIGITSGIVKALGCLFGN